MTRYRPEHLCQYDWSAITRTSGCTWTSAAMGVDAQSGGSQAPTPDEVHATVDRDEETSPATPGWSMRDVSTAMRRLGVPFSDRTHTGWAGVRAFRAAGLYIILQGDSDRFTTGCSGAFDGDHAIGIHPDDADDGRWVVNDPICRTARRETEATLRAYAEKFDPLVRFGVFTVPVPLLPPDTSTGGSMKFEPQAPRIGVATLKATAKLYRVSDGAVIPKPVATRNVYAHASWGDTTGYLVTYKDEAHLLKASDCTYVADKPAPVPYPVKMTLTVGDKPVSVTTGPLTLP